MKDLLEKPKRIKLKSHKSLTGKLTFFEGIDDVDFQIKRSFWISGVPAGEKRGVHAHKKERQLLVCLHGSVSIKLESLAKEIYSFDLSSPDEAVMIPPMNWSSVSFSDNTILLVMSDQAYDELDYIRDRKEFEKAQNKFLSGNGS